MSAMSDRVINMLERWLPCALLGALLSGCGSTGDGSPGVGSGQQPDPVAPDFAIAPPKSG